MCKINPVLDLLKCEQTNKGLRLTSGIALCDMAVIVTSHTGSVGSSWTEEFLLGAGTDIDAFGQEIAENNAATYGLEGSYVCKSCGDEGDSEECESCCSQAIWEENENISFSIYKYQPDVSCSSVNGGSPIANIIEWAIEAGHISIQNNKALIYLNALKGFIHLPTQTDINYLVEEMAAIHNLTTVEFA